MVVHEAPCDYLYALKDRESLEVIQITAPIVIVFEDSLASSATRDYMIDSRLSSLSRLPHILSIRL